MFKELHQKYPLRAILFFYKRVRPQIATLLPANNDIESIVSRIDPILFQSSNTELNFL
jgi:hypothetical protein